jgi:hypothetical protein
VLIYLGDAHPKKAVKHLIASGTRVKSIESRLNLLTGKGVEVRREGTADQETEGDHLTPKENRESAVSSD